MLASFVWSAVTSKLGLRCEDVRVLSSGVLELKEVESVIPEGRIRAGKVLVASFSKELIFEDVDLIAEHVDKDRFVEKLLRRGGWNAFVGREWTLRIIRAHLRVNTRRSLGLAFEDLVIFPAKGMTREATLSHAALYVGDPHNDDRDLDRARARTYHLPGTRLVKVEVLGFGLSKDQSSFSPTVYEARIKVIDDSLFFETSKPLKVDGNAFVAWRDNAVIRVEIYAKSVVNERHVASAELAFPTKVHATVTVSKVARVAATIEFVAFDEPATFLRLPSVTGIIESKDDEDVKIHLNKNASVDASLVPALTEFFLDLDSTIARDLAGATKSPWRKARQMLTREVRLSRQGSSLFDEIQRRRDAKARRRPVALTVISISCDSGEEVPDHVIVSVTGDDFQRTTKKLRLLPKVSPLEEEEKEPPVILPTSDDSEDDEKPNARFVDGITTLSGGRFEASVLETFDVPDSVFDVVVADPDQTLYPIIGPRELAAARKVTAGSVECLPVSSTFYDDDKKMGFTVLLGVNVAAEYENNEDHVFRDRLAQKETGPTSVSVDGAKVGVKLKNVTALVSNLQLQYQNNGGSLQADIDAGDCSLKGARWTLRDGTVDADLGRLQGPLTALLGVIQAVDPREFRKCRIALRRCLQHFRHVSGNRLTDVLHLSSSSEERRRRPEPEETKVTAVSQEMPVTRAHSSDLAVTARSSSSYFAMKRFLAL